MSEINFNENFGTFHLWKTKKGKYIKSGTVLFCYKSVDDSVVQFKSDSSGIVNSLAELKSGDSIENGSVVVTLKPCSHRVVMKDLCGDCGADLRQKDGRPGDRSVSTQANVAMIHTIPELQITAEEAKLHGAEDINNLLVQRKLVLLVDLDQTLIHTTNEVVSDKLKDVHHYQLYGSHSPWYHTRIRPHTTHFLTEMSKIFELHICTFGQRLYAHTIAKILDPTGKLFGQRILSRDECFDANLKTANLKALFPTGDKLVCIIDDRADVWQWAPNCVHVKPYRFFKHTGDINAPPGMEKTDANTEHQFQFSHDKTEEQEVTEGKFPDVTDDQQASEKVEDEDDYLYYLEDILAKLHSAYYQLYDKTKGKNEEDIPDMKTVVPYVRGKVLSDVYLVLSSIVPTSVQLKSTPVYQAATSFGCQIQEQIVTKEMGENDTNLNPTTHLVAAKWGTNKVNQAAKMDGVKIVQPHWLWCCIERWEKVDEAIFLLAKDQKAPSLRIPARIEMGLAPQGQDQWRKSQEEEPSSTQEPEGDSTDSPAKIHPHDRHKSEPHFLNLNIFSHDQLGRMSAEVEDALSENDPESGSEAGNSNSDSDSLSGDTPKGWKRKSKDLMLNQELNGKGKKRKLGEDSSSSSDDDVDDDDEAKSIGSIDEEMAEALEKEMQ